VHSRIRDSWITDLPKPKNFALMLRLAAAFALVVLASVALSADAQVQEAQWDFLTPDARASPLLAQRGVLCA
jgi:hypothetical protein